MHLPLSSDLYIYIHTTYENRAERRWDHARLLYIGASGYTQAQTHTHPHTFAHFPEIKPKAVGSADYYDV